jgi:SSS family solute:Na+ symporter
VVRIQPKEPNVSPEAILALAAVALFIAVGFLNKRMKWNASVSEFAGRNTGITWFRVAVGLAMTFAGGAATLNMASLGYQYGWQPLIDPAVVLLAGVLALPFVVYMRTGESNTIGELLSGQSQYLHIFYGLVSGVVYVLLAAAQFVALGKLLAPLLPDIPVTVVIAIPSVLIYIYIVLGGLRSVTQTDILQFILISAFFAIPSILAFVGFASHSNGGTVAAPEFEAIPFELAAYLTFPLLFVPFSQDLAVRARAARSLGQARVGIAIGVVMYAVVVAAAVHIGVYARQQGLVLSDTETVVGSFFNHSFPALHAFVAVAVAAAIASTLDSWTYSAILIVAADLLPGRVNKAAPPKHRIVIGAGIVLALALTVALAVQEILALILLALYIYVAVLVPSALGRRLGLRDSVLAFLATITALSMIAAYVASIDVPLQPYTFPALHAIAVSVAVLLPACRARNRTNGGGK